MKTRTGFVSNSSSSSFVVPQYENWIDQKKKLLTKADEKALRKLGFALKICYYPDQVMDNKDDDFVKEAPQFANWCREVTCNQEDEIFMLLKARITFTADIHYGHYSMIYDGKTDVLLIAQNFGKQIQMGGAEKMTFASAKEANPVERTTGKKYLKTHKL